MNGKTLIPILFLLFLFTTGASIIDKETKQGVLSTNEKIDKLATQDQVRSAELMTLVNEIRELKSLLGRTPRPDPPSGKEAALRSEELRQIKEIRDILSSPSFATEGITLEQAHHAELVGLVKELKELASRPRQDQTMEQTNLFKDLSTRLATLKMTLEERPMSSERIAVSLEELKGRLEEAEFHTRLSLSITILGFFLMLILTSIVSWILIRNSKEKIRRIEEDHGRPRLKIESTAECLELINVGEKAASEVRFSFGRSPFALKRKLKVSSQMGVGEKAFVNFPARSSDEVLHAILEYTNPETNHIYKEPFILKFDQLTGHPEPLQQVS